MTAISELRPSSIAGTWYEAHAERLAHAVDGYISSASLPPLLGRVLAVVAPHAGHRFSGPVAGYAFATVKGMAPDVVAVVSPMHHFVNYSFITTAHAAYSTPLGQIPVDHGLLKQLNENLISRLGYGLASMVNDPEHSLEIELPFLQRALQPGFKLLPLMLREQTRESARHVGAALADVLEGHNALLVASTDLSHFHRQSRAEALDNAMLQQVANFSPEGVFDVEESGLGEACGLGALSAVLWAAKMLGAGRVQILKHATSADVTGDFQSVVGYGAAVVLKNREDTPG